MNFTKRSFILPQQVQNIHIFENSIEVHNYDSCFGFAFSDYISLIIRVFIDKRHHPIEIFSPKLLTIAEFCIERIGNFYMKLANFIPV